MIRAFVLLLSLAAVSSEEAIDNPPSLNTDLTSKQNPTVDEKASDERQLGQIRVEEDSEATGAPQANPKPTKKTKVNKKSVILRHIDKIISEFGLDQPIDRKKINSYFNGLSHRIYRNLRKSLSREKKSFQGYNEILKKYKNVAATYGIGKKSKMNTV